MMEATIKEIAAILRSTEQMASQFVQRVETRLGQPVSHAEILAAMQDIPAKSLSMERVITKLKRKRKPTKPQSSRRQTAHEPSGPIVGPVGSITSSTAGLSSPVPPKRPKTILERLEYVLRENWDRAEAEGLQPNRMSTEAFVNAVYQYTDRREGTRRRILQAAEQLSSADVVLTPALVADTVHELFEG
jgi:hypothetical protein